MYSACQLLFSPFPWCVWIFSCWAAQWPPAEDGGCTRKLWVEICEGHCWKMVISRSLLKIRWHGHWWGWFRSLGAQRKTSMDGAEGRSACQGGCNIAQLTLWYFNQSTASVINRKGSQVKKKPFQLQPLELQCRTHVHTYIQHTQTITHGLGQSPKADTSVSKAGLFAPKLQLIHIKC